MTMGKDRNRLILELLYAKGEMSFSDLENAGVMAKSTLNDHLRELLEEKAVKKVIGKRPPHVNHPVYVITTKGRRAYERMSKVHGHMLSLRDF